MCSVTSTLILCTVDYVGPTMMNDCNDHYLRILEIRRWEEGRFGKIYKGLIL